MHLNKFQELDKKIKKQVFITLGIATFLLISVVIVIRSYAVYQEEQEFDVINGIIPGFNDNYDVKVSFIVDGVVTSKMPNKESGKTVDSIVCDNNSWGVWDYDKWTLKVRNLSKSRTKCKINFVTKYTESILNGTDPVLKEDLIPVTIESDGVVKRASLGSEWYNYGNKQWANAVILLDKTKTYGIGEVIPEENIESYFVWIPRYKYKLFNMGNYETLTGTLTNNKLPSVVSVIDVVFGLDETSDTSSSCATPMVSGASGNCSVGKYMTHPAFITFNTTGLWVGKFETGYKGSTDASSAQVNAIEPNSIQIKPNVHSWSDIQPANAFYSAYDYQRDLDSHMMKNTEWGAVAYLTNSIYGRCSGSTCEEVRINNTSDYVTGYAGKNEPTTGNTTTNISCSTTPSACNEYGEHGTLSNAYNTDGGYLASTTGNISGIYDMSGGAWEFVMGVMLDISGNLVSGRNDKLNSNFIGILTYPNDGTDKTKTEWTLSDGGVRWPNNAYYDTYTFSANDETYNRRILGDATGEMGPFATATYGTQNRQIGSWYADEAWIVIHGGPWFRRGEGYSQGIGAGVLAFAGYYGHGAGGYSFRVVLAV